MDISPTQDSRYVLQEGSSYFLASEALLKGVLEAESPVALISGPNATSFASLFAHVAAQDAAAALRAHHCSVLPVLDAARGITLALQTAEAGRAGVALVPADQLEDALDALHRAIEKPLHCSGAMCLVIEETSASPGTSHPRRIAKLLNLPCLEAGSVGKLRDSVDQAVRLSRAERRPAIIVVHESILHSGDTLDARPNRVIDRIDMAGVLRRRRRPRTADASSALQAARRLEINRSLSMPSPGERVGVGFLTVGPAANAMLHLLRELTLTGQVPMVELALAHPVDPPVIVRLLERSEHVIVLEPHPGEIGPTVLEIAETMRHGGKRPAIVWFWSIPPDATGHSYSLDPGDALRPSILARKLIHLLHDIRPRFQVAKKLTTVPRWPVTISLPPRDVSLGAGAAQQSIREMLEDIDTWLNTRAPLEEKSIDPTALIIDGKPPDRTARRQVFAEVWDNRRFRREGPAALAHSVESSLPRILVVCDLSQRNESSLHRFTEGIIPASGASRVVVQSAPLAEPLALRTLLREAAMRDGVTVIISRDSPDAKFNPEAVANTFSEIDQLGYRRMQRKIWSIGSMCGLRQRTRDESSADGPRNRTDTLASDVSLDQFSRRLSRGVRFRVRPLLAEVEVVRTRPPVTVNSPHDGPARLHPPRPIHAGQGVWRVHLAGYRGHGPGLAALAIAAAGRLMGYHVKTVHDPAPIGPGRQAWAQVMFTRADPDRTADAIDAAIPYGEADLLIGVDTLETLRAVGIDPYLRIAATERTHVVANRAPLEDQADLDDWPKRGEIENFLRNTCHESNNLIDDLAHASRAVFQTDRLTDCVALGAAYQLGLIPVRLEAMQRGLRDAAKRTGRPFGRSTEALQLGRRFVATRDLEPSHSTEDDEPIEIALRRMELQIGQSRCRGRDLARRFGKLARQTLAATPGLAETDIGRIARRDLLIAMRRCLTWGGFSYAERFAQLITSLYAADRPDYGRDLTRLAVLPLAEAMLIRDPIYAAAIATGPEPRRRVRQRFIVRPARGDHVRRWFLTRVELLMLDRRLRLELKTGPWPLRLLAASDRFIPDRWRGTPDQRELREHICDLISRAASNARTDYRTWHNRLRRLHTLAVKNRLPTMTTSTLQSYLLQSYP